MTARHHYLPRVYLRGWCTNGNLVRYRTAGTPPTLREERVTPESFAFENDLYVLPTGGIANGLEGDQLEKLLANEIEKGFPKLLDDLRAAGSGIVTDALLTESVLTFMRVTNARRPEMLRKLADGVANIQFDNREVAERMRAQAITPKSQEELRQLLDPRRGDVTARAMVAALVRGFVPNGWLAGAVQTVCAADVPGALEAVGVENFTTTDQPLVEWEDGPFAASFVLAPDLMAIVLRDAFAEDQDVIGGIVAKHHLRVPKHRATHYAVSQAPLAEGSPLKAVLKQFLQPWRSRQR